ncbi:MAG: fumarylacetoacetase [Betaproteobacteria bacterium]|nr:fumarylacetoacetase [Betaproteobacteria bacterium]MCC6246527.1 fumarylacetoacetase [Rubrivivax sp.]MCL4697122.1 fumarylacetoacetase [Burkholderiaceae bacterium]
MLLTDATHDPALKSWVESANTPDHDFPIQNLPFARMRPAGADDEPWRIGVAIGDHVLDIKLARQQSPWGEGIDALLAPLAEGDLAAFMTLGPRAWTLVREALSMALAADSDQAPFLELCLLDPARLEYSLPCRIGDYSDFYAGIHHARTVGSLFRPDNPLLPNYPWVPIGYHGRASSVVVQGGTVRRPLGQTRGSGGDSGEPTFGPCRRLDYELELGLWIGAGNDLGERVDMEEAEKRLFGITPLNDWSARDIQAWEYQPLGPFLSKSFATFVSPWVVTFEALAPFRRPFRRAPGEPQPLPYLDSLRNRECGALDIQVEAWLQTARMKAARQPAVRLSRASVLEAAYWTPAQLVAHHTSNGCNLQVGDLLGTGTLSGPQPGQGGSLLELSGGGKAPLALPGGEQRTFLEDGDTLTLKAWCEAPGAVRIGLGAVTGTIEAAA